LSAFAVDVVIPTYREEKYLDDCLKNLTEQSMYRSKSVNIIISDYNPDNNKETAEICKNYELVTYIQCVGKGIAHGRNVGIKAGNSPVIVNFDADAKFSDPNAIYLLSFPILKGDVVLTKCDYVLDEQPTNLMMYISNFFTIAERYLPIGRTAGLTVSRQAFEQVGGFRNIVAAEDYALNVDITTVYGYFNTKYIPDISVIASSRRFKKFDSDGLGIMDYKSNHYR
jgi:glycosyltransferase involved in cell wall biosynthesis